MKSYGKGYHLFGPGWCTIMDWLCPMGYTERDLLVEVSEVKVCSLILVWMEITKTSHCSPVCCSDFFFLSVFWQISEFCGTLRWLCRWTCGPPVTSEVKYWGQTKKTRWFEMLTRGDLGHRCGNVTEQGNTNWVLAVGEQHGPLKCVGGISYQCQACSTIWGQAFSGEMETMEIFSSAESWNNLRRLGAAGQLSKLPSPFQIHEWSQTVLNRYSKTDAGS